MSLDAVAAVPQLGSHYRGPSGAASRARHRGRRPGCSAKASPTRPAWRWPRPCSSRLLGADLVDHWTYAQVGDGCLQEGVGQEIISLAGHLRLGKLVFLWDDNRMTDDGPIDIALSDDVPARFRLSHWHVQEVDGHDIDAVSDALGARPSGTRARH